MPSITVREYFAREFSEFSNRDAKIIGPVLHELSRQGGVTARDVLDAARSSNSPLHPYFEWDNKIAADEYRLYQARSMLRSIKIQYVENGEYKESKAFHVVHSAPYEAQQRTYKTFQVMHGDSAFAAQMLDAAFDDLMAWRRKYGQYVGMWQNFGDTFQQVINQIAEWEEEFPSEQAAIDTDGALASLLAWRESYDDILKTWTACRQSIEYVMEAIGEAEKKFAKVNETKYRDCLKCGRSFKSVGFGNRLCKACLNSKTVNEKNVGIIDATMIGK